MTINSLSNAGYIAQTLAEQNYINGAQKNAAQETVQQTEAAQQSQRAKDDSHDTNQAAKPPIPQGLELRVGVLPNTNVILIRFVDSSTGEVVREFPPEKLAEALAEIRERACAHLDKKA